MAFRKDKFKRNRGYNSRVGSLLRRFGTTDSKRFHDRRNPSGQTKQSFNFAKKNFGV